MSVYPAKMSLAEGEMVSIKGRLGFIVEVLNLQTLVVSDYETGRTETVSINEVRPCKPLVDGTPELDGLSEAMLEVAKQRFKYIQPMLKMPGRTRKDVEMRVSEIGLHENTLYRWIKRYESSKLLTSLAPRKRKDVGQKRLLAEVESIINEVIESEYLTRQKKTGAYVCMEIRRRCLEEGLKPPHDNTIRKRLKYIPNFKRTARRLGNKIAKDKFIESKGEFPGADWPLSFVQIDHTQLDIIWVDDVNRQPIGRPWITLAMDVFSRMVTGFHISLEPPSATSVGLCLSHSILPKEKWLRDRGIEDVWPCYGVPKTIHADNAREFRGETLKLVCEQYGIGLEWRPVARPNFGAHVERLLGTFAKAIHSLPGTTFSNIQERGRYDSEEKAIFTLSEFESWIAVNIIQVYQRSFHSSLSMAPVDKYKQGVLGDENRPGTGLPELIVDEEKLMLDFLPYVERTIQSYGVAVDSVHYWHDVLRPWVNAMDPDSLRTKRKFIFRRDPRDISSIWFFDPEVERYYSIPYRDTSHPPISVWELREAKRRLVEAGRKAIDEVVIFDALTRLRELEEASKSKTKASRRARQRKTMGIGATSRRVSSKQESTSQDFDLGDLDNLQPFDDLDDS